LNGGKSHIHALQICSPLFASFAQNAHLIGIKGLYSGQVGKCTVTTPGKRDYRTSGVLNRKLRSFSQWVP
jgi:hypothetical protein